MRIVHFSDFHLDGNHIERAKTIVRRLTDSLMSIQKERPIDLVLFTGDLVNLAGSGFPNIQTAFNKFKEIVIEPIIESLGISLNRFIFTLGNHDINGDRIRSAEDLMSKHNDLKTKLLSHDQVDDYMHSQNLCVPQVEDYNNFRNAYWIENKGDAEVDIHSIFQYSIKGSSINSRM